MNIVIMSPHVYHLDPALAERIARDLGVTIEVRDTLFREDTQRVIYVCEALKQHAQIGRAPNNRAARRDAKFARRTNAEGWQ